MLGKTVKPMGLVLIGVIVIGAICLFSVFGGLKGLFGGSQPSTGSFPSGGSGSSVQQGDLGQLYTAVDVDQYGCPVQRVSEFYPEDTVFVGLTESLVPQGTEMFMRLYYEGQAIEDTQPIQADQDQQSCVWFQFQPSGSYGMEPGNYEAELVVNGNPTDTIAFQVTGSTSGGGYVPNTGGSSDYGNGELGRSFAATGVDSNGCPVDDVSEFYPDETVYVGFEESYIPAGTEMFARLVQDGQVLEDTAPIRTDQDLQSCVWFQFQAGQYGGGFDQGDYEAELYANGNLVDTVQFGVR